MRFNAVIVAGGRSSRLGGVDKAGLSNGSVTLLASTLQAVEGAVHRVVVGPRDLPLPAGVLVTQEDPPFSGPASGLAAGLALLGADAAEWTLVLSVDMPFVASAVSPLVEAAELASPPVDGLMGRSDGVFQPLLGIYRTEALRGLLGQESINRSVRSWLAPLNYLFCDLPSGSARDVDTWEQARATGFTDSQW